METRAGARAGDRNVTSAPAPAARDALHLRAAEADGEIVEIASGSIARIADRRRDCGRRHAAPFGSVATALWAGAADDPATTVVYVFSKPVTCSELKTPGWDTRITNGTSVLKMKSFGTTPGSYKVVTTLTPVPGGASVEDTLSSTTGTPKEDGSTIGTVTLTTLTANTSAKGSFTLTFGTSSLTGSFDAVYCSGGHEP